MRNCLFCNTPLSAAIRAKEHVLRKSWLRQLGHEKLVMTGVKLRGQTVVTERNSLADQLLAGEVCEKCNNGWMNHLDERVEHIVLGLARRPGFIDEIKLSNVQARLIGRWLLKTACAHQYTDQRDRRHIPHTIRSKVHVDNFLPPGFIAFAIRSYIPEKNIEIALLDAWPEECIRSLSQTGRLKFAVRYDNIIFGCCYWSAWHPTYVLTPGYHLPLVTSQARFRYEEGYNSHYLKRLDEKFTNQLQRQIRPTDLALISIGLDLPLA